jgi:serine/threonine-protein kinase
MQLGKYELVRRLAAGGMAEVFLARALGPMGFEKTLVLKRILPHLAEDPSFVEMFLAEAKLAAQLNHPNIVQIFDFGESQGEYFLAMEHIDGLNLRVLLKRARARGVALPAELCARIIACACEGLGFAHDFRSPTTGQPLGLVHRDVSTDNILVSRQGAVKVVDFGIAKAADQSHKTRTGVVKGKLAYMPPEQIRAMSLDRRLDIYALGVVLYELLTGHKPFSASSDANLMQAILFEPQVPAVQRRPDLPASLQRILERALAKEREQRYPDCRAFLVDLENFILSTGKSASAYQLAEFVTQLMPSDAENTPAPDSTSDAPTSSPRTVPSVTARALETRSALPRRRLNWLPAVMGTALLMAGGGYILAAQQASPVPAVVVSPAQLSVPVSSQNLAAVPAEPVVPLIADDTARPSVQTATAEQEAPPVTQPEDSKRSLQAAPTPVTRGHTSSARKQGSSQVGTLHLVMRGWADIWVDGEKMGRVPPINELKLPAGRHEVKLINPAVPPYRAIVTITAGKTLEHNVVFQAPSSPKQEPETKERASTGLTAGQLTMGAH